MNAWRLRALLPALIFALAAGAARADAGREIHGESDVFAIDGVAIAWGILRAANPDDATVVMRIARDDARYPSLGVVAVDPFSGKSQPVRAASAAAATVDVPSRRARFGDFARTEVRLYASARPGAAEAAALTIFYQGVPDTTPEFDTEAKLRDWLDGRIARLRANPGGKRP
jgi:hypothetical protein